MALRTGFVRPEIVRYSDEVTALAEASVEDPTAYFDIDIEIDKDATDEARAAKIKGEVRAFQIAARKIAGKTARVVQSEPTKTGQNVAFQLYSLIERTAAEVEADAAAEVAAE